MRADAEAILSLLSESDLPADGVIEGISSFFVADLSGLVIGTAGLETHGHDGLLRSVVVKEGMRGRGIGRRLASRVIGAARSANLRNLYLLTTSAEAYFPRHGFVRVDRESVTREIQDSVEFRDVCPSTATAMVLHLCETEPLSIHRRT